MSIFRGAANRTAHKCRTSRIRLRRVLVVRKCRSVVTFCGDKMLN